MGHLHIGVQGLAMCRSSQQRAAYIATCRQRLNADEKQQHCYEEELLSHIRLLPLLKTLVLAISYSSVQTVQHASVLILIVAPFALRPQNVRMRSLKICSRSLFFIYHLDRPMEFTEILLPDTASRSWLAILIVSRGGSRRVELRMKVSSDAT
jgi:hypothetical protein